MLIVSCFTLALLSIRTFLLPPSIVYYRLSRKPLVILRLVILPHYPPHLRFLRSILILVTFCRGCVIFKLSWWAHITMLVLVNVHELVVLVKNRLLIAHERAQATDIDSINFFYLCNCLANLSLISCFAYINITPDPHRYLNASYLPSLSNTTTVLHLFRLIATATLDSVEYTKVEIITSQLRSYRYQHTVSGSTSRNCRFSSLYVLFIKSVYRVTSLSNQHVWLITINREQTSPTDKFYNYFGRSWGSCHTSCIMGI